MRESIYGATLEDDERRAKHIDEVVSRLWRGGVRRTEFPSSGGATRVDCTDGGPVQRPHDDEARGHRHGGGMTAGG